MRGVPVSLSVSSFFVWLSACLCLYVCVCVCRRLPVVYAVHVQVVWWWCLKERCGEVLATKDVRVARHTTPFNLIVAGGAYTVPVTSKCAWRCVYHGLFRQGRGGAASQRGCDLDLHAWEDL